MTLVDTNVLLDLVTSDPVWAEWSIAALETASLQGPLLINAVIYAELSARYERIEELDEFVRGVGLELVEIPRPSLFLASKVFRQYRSSGGTRTGVLPDFFVGAHAIVLDIPLISRDIGRFRTYFPMLKLITPTDLR